MRGGRSWRRLRVWRMARVEEGDGEVWKSLAQDGFLDVMWCYE